MAARKLFGKFTSLSLKSPSVSSSSSSSSARLRPISLFNSFNSGIGSPVRYFSSDETPSSPPNFLRGKEPLILCGCDYEHWLVVLDKLPPPETPREDIIDEYVRILTTVVGSEQLAREKIYSVSTKHYFGFGALLSQELAYKLRDVQNVRFVLPDSYLDAEKEDYGGEPFINGKAVPYDPKYHAVWLRRERKRQLEQERKKQEQQQQGQQESPQGGDLGSPVGQSGRGTGPNNVGSLQVGVCQHGRGRASNLSNQNPEPNRYRINHSQNK